MIFFYNGNKLCRSIKILSSAFSAGDILSSLNHRTAIFVERNSDGRGSIIRNNEKHYKKVEYRCSKQYDHILNNEKIALSVLMNRKNIGILSKPFSTFTIFANACQLRNTTFHAISVRLNYALNGFRIQSF